MVASVSPVSFARFRRPFAGLLVAVLLGSLLSVVGAAGAANTVVEGSVDSSGKRVLAGADRYSTSVALARQALAADAASPDEVIVVSGVTAVDAFAAVGLATARDAVVLLTEADSLPRVVRRFIDEQEFTQVTVVGGTAAVSDAVADRLSRLETVTDVARITGDDRFDTSAATATAAGDAGVWCDSDESVVFMVGGRSLADGVAVAPVATKMGTSVLLNPADELHASVADVLDPQDEDAQQIERVVIVGSEAEIGSAVATEVAGLGIEVTRVDGGSAAARSVALAKLVSGSDCEAADVAPNQFALVNGDASAGAATLGTALASALVDTGDLVPVLLVGDELPAEVGAHLGSIPTKVGSDFQNTVLHAVGGTAAVTQAVIDAAIEAGTTSGPITATFKVGSRSASVAITFSDPLDHSSVGLEDFRLNGMPLPVSDRLSTHSAAPHTHLLSFSNYTLVPGDVIEIVAGGIRGAQVADGSPRNDNRTVGSIKHTVPGPSVDRARPRLDVAAAEGADRVRVVVNEFVSADPQDMLNTADVSLTLGDTVLEVGEDGSNPHGLGVFRDNRISFFDALSVPYLIGWGCTGTTQSTCTGEIGGVATTLSAGDRVAIAAGAVVDRAGNSSRSTIVRVSANSSKPALTGSPTLSTGTPTGATATVSVSYNGGSTYIFDTRWLLRFLSGSAGGNAGGNDWTLFVLKRADTADDGEAETVDVDVAVIESRKTIQVVFDDEATAADIGDALAAQLRSLVQVNEHTNTAPAHVRNNFFSQQNINLSDDDGSGSTFGNGRTKVFLTLTFKEPLKEFDWQAFVAAQPEGSKFGSTRTDGIERVDLSFREPSPVVSLLYTYSDQSLVPTGGETIVLPAGVATDYEDNSNSERRSIRVRSAN